MRDDSCIGFLQWVLPCLHMRWPGFRKVRRQVCKRIQKRLAELNLPDANAYRIYLENHAEIYGSGGKREFIIMYSEFNFYDHSRISTTKN